jgi:DNA-binding response OmpR family regulator
MTKVLIIEDDQSMSSLYKNALEMEDGFEVQLADNGLTAEEILPNFTPDIILLDIMMPTVNGLEFLTKLKEDPNTAGIPVLVLTNVSDANITHMAREKGAVMVLIKSENDPDQVIEAIRGVLARSDQPDES